MKNLLLCAAVVAALAGCASNQPVASAEDVGAREYPTGSNIPRKGRSTTDGVKAYDREELERARSQAHQQVRPGLGGTP
jgi:hypothetical protein